MRPLAVVPRDHRTRAATGLRLALAFLLWLGLAHAAPPTPTIRDLDVGSVRVGMAGYAVTAGPGNELARFPVEVLAVQHDAGPGFPLVLIRASGPFIEASGGVAAGMSGSPVYLGTTTGEALLGAIAYVFPAAAHDLALVTPIAAMRAGFDGSGEGAPIAMSGYGVAMPVATPILMTGLSARAAAMLEPLFRDARVRPLPVQAGNAAEASANDDLELQPGSAISVQLVRGDITIGAVGTVTVVEGDDVLAFGHPLLGQGNAAFVLAAASVTAIVPSSVVPFKLANSGTRVLGVIRQDRPTGIGGSLGPGPKMIAVNLHVSAPNGTRDFAFEVIPDERVYPQLVAAATLELLDRTLAATTAGSAELAWQIGLGEGDRLNLVDQADDDVDIALATARLAGSPLYGLSINSFRDPGFHSLDLTVRVTERRNAAAIQEVVAENTEVTPGEAVIAHVRLQPYREEATVKTLSLAIPDDVEGTVVVTVRGGDVSYENDEEPDADAEPRSFAELLDAMRGHPQASDLVAEIPGENGKVRRLARLSLDFVVTGQRTFEITIGDDASTADADEAEPSSPADKPNEPTPTRPEGYDRAP